MTDTEASLRLEEFDAHAATINLQGQWKAEAHLIKAIGGPAPAGIPFRWKRDELAQAMDEATVALGPVDTARRHLTCINPGLKGPAAGTTHTMSAGLQLVKPGEVCWSHRHSMAAIRFVTQGNPDAYTAVDGEKLIMEDFDLLLTPRFSWHDHHNPSDQDVVWLDGLDVGLLRGLGAVFYEPYGESSQHIRERAGDGIGTRSHWLRPTWEQDRGGRLPIRYPWREVKQRLDLYDGVEGSPYDGLALRYANPVNGGPTLPTLDCWVQRLLPGFSGLPHRRSSSSISFVIQGSGQLVTDDEVIDFAQGDVFVVPNWTTHRLVNDSDAEPTILFTLTDIPMYTPFGLFYEEPEDIIGASLAPANPTPPLTPIYREGAFYDRDEK